MPNWLSFSGAHFEIHYQGADKALIQDINRRLEDHYFPLTNLFEVDFEEKLDVYIHPDLSALKQNLKLDEKSDWLVGLAKGDKEIHLVSPRNPPGNHSYESVMEGLVHEFVHVCVARANRNRLPVWLNEGLAVYFAGQGDFAREVPGILNNMISLPSLMSLSEPERFAARHGYPLSYTIIEMVEKFAGQGGISRWVKEYPDYSALGLSSHIELEQLWHAHLQEKYKNPEPLVDWSMSDENIFQVSLEPNPVKDFGDLRFYAPSDGIFTLDVLDPWGGKIQNLTTKKINSGFHAFRIDARDFPPGMYYLELRTADQRQLLKFTH